MPQLFRPSANSWSRVSLLAALGGIVAAGIVLLILSGSAYLRQMNIVVEQPVPFSHRHHVAIDGIPCAYCHAQVDRAAFAGMPSTKTCMTCHSQLWTDSPLLRVVRESFISGEPIPWRRVHDLADFVYFHHGIHIQKGIACVTCHGRVDEMALTAQVAPLTMRWCLDCHRAPERFIRPREAVFDIEYTAPPNQLEVGRGLVERYGVRRPTDCSVCHR